MHDHSHDHHTSSSHHAHHAQARGAAAHYGRAFVIAITLNSVFVVTEFTCGFLANSTALMADAGHNLSDVLGLLLAWGATLLARRAPTGRFSYGLRSSSILAALANATILMVACGAIAWEAIERMAAPPPVAALTVTFVAGVGIVINGLSAWLFAGGSKGDLNIRGAYLHMLADAAVSLGVVAAGLAILYTGWNWLDPLISLLIVAVIVVGTWKLLLDSMHLALAATPAHIDPAAVERYLRDQPGVSNIHDLHIWGMSTTENAMTVHLVMPGGHPGDEAIDGIAQSLYERFGVQHSTMQIELGTTEHACVLHPTSEPQQGPARRSG